MGKMIILGLVGLAAFFVLPAAFPALEHVAFHIADVGVRYVHLVTIAALGFTLKALN